MLPVAAQNNYRRRQAVTSAAVRQVRSLWRRMGVDYDESWALIGTDVVSAVASAKATAAAAAGRYVPEAAAELDMAQETEWRLAPARFAVSAADGRSLDTLMQRAVIEAKVATSTGAAPREALRLAGDWLLDTVAEEVRQASMSGEWAAMIATPQVTGYTRMLNPPSCKWCVILAGKWFRWNQGFQRHAHCDCAHIPARESMQELRTDPYAYFHSLTEHKQNQLFGKNDAQAIRDGADIYRVVNVRQRGLATTAQARRFNAPTRMTIDDIVAASKGDRAAAIDMMRSEGFITGRGQVPGGVLLGPSHETARGARAAAREAVIARGGRDTLDPYAMTAEERRLYDTAYRIKFYERHGVIPRTIGANSADRGIATRAAGPGESGLLRARLDRLGNLALQPSRSAGAREHMAKFLATLEDATLSDLMQAQERSLNRSTRAARAIGRR